MVALRGSQLQWRKSLQTWWKQQEKNWEAAWRGLNCCHLVRKSGRRRSCFSRMSKERFVLEMEAAPGEAAVKVVEMTTKDWEHYINSVDEAAARSERTDSSFDRSCAVGKMLSNGITCPREIGGKGRVHRRGKLHHCLRSRQPSERGRPSSTAQTGLPEGSEGGQQFSAKKSSKLRPARFFLGNHAIAHLLRYSTV